MSTRWYYAKAGTTDRQGPVSVEQIQEKLRTGELSPQDIVWRQGLPQWAPISAMPELSAAPAMPARSPVASRLPPAPPPMGTPARPAPPTAAPIHAEAIEPAHAPTAATVGYFTPGADMPERARDNLEGYAKPTGPIGDWPLGDNHVLQLADAVRWRKRILAAHGLVRLFFLIGVIVSIIMCVMLAIGFAASRNFARDVLPMLASSAIVLPLTILYGFAGRAIKYCRSWGSLVMAILTTLGLLANLASVALSVTARPGGPSSGDLPAMVAAAIIIILIGGAISYVFWRAWAATPKYLASPVWCQEALAVAEKSK